MDENKKKIDNAIDELNNSINSGALQRLSDDQLSNISKLIDEILEKLEE